MEEKDSVNIDFDSLISAFVNLNAEEKAMQIIKSLKEDIAIIDSISELYNLKFPILLNREVLDINKNNPTTDDYFEAIYVYIKSLEDLLGKLLYQISNNTSNL